MFSFIVGRVLMNAVKGLERPLEQLENAFAIWAGEKKQEPRIVVNLEVEVNQEQLGELTSNPELRRAMGRACIARDMGAVPSCVCCGAAL